MRHATSRAAIAIAGALALAACGGGGDDAATPGVQASTTVTTAVPAPTTAAAAAGTTTTAAAPVTTTTAAPAVAKVNANTATRAQLAAAFEAANISNASRWAIEVEENPPNPTNDPTFAKLRQNLAKYNPGPGVVDAIVATLSL